MVAMISTLPALRRRKPQPMSCWLRLIAHQSRTFTIKQWAGLSDDRIRNLHKSYVLRYGAHGVLQCD